jgi:type VI secretion system FHA domain protein
MLLTLEVIGPQAGKLPGGGRKVFQSTGGTIGRQQGNDWVLADQFVSNRHASIHYKNGVFYLEATEARNPVYLSSRGQENCLEKGRLYPLQTGDLVVIEPYEIRVSITDSAYKAPAPVDDPFALLSDAVAPRDDLSRRDRRELRPSVDPVESLGLESLVMEEGEVDPEKLLNIEPTPRGEKGRRSEKLQNHSVLVDHFVGPKPVEPDPPQEAGPLIPDDYDPSKSSLHTAGQSPRNPSPPQNRSRQPRDAEVDQVARNRSGSAKPPGVSRGSGSPMPPRSGESSPPRNDMTIQEVLAGAGLTDVRVDPDLARDFGQILRIVVAGLMELLEARKDFKSEFGVGITTFKRIANNPIKCSADVDDALHNLFVKHSPAYLPPVEAFEEALKDVQGHQLAMLAGLRTVFDNMLDEFDPDRLQANFDAQAKRGALLAKPPQWRYWEQYREKVEAMLRDRDRTFRALIGDELADAYQEQIQRLKVRGSSSGRPPMVPER